MNNTISNSPIYPSNNRKYKTVLSRFIKILMAASLALSANISLAGHHAEAEEKIRDLKDMTPTQVDDAEVIEDVFEANKDSTEDTSETALDRVNEMSDEAKDSITEDAQQKLKTKISPEG